MTIGVVVFIVIMLCSLAIKQGQAKALLTILGYLVAAACVVAVTVLACAVGYAFLIESLWNR